MCSETCICAECDASIREVFFGDEDEKDARFIKLTDCGHVFEVKGLDRYMVMD